MLSVDGLIFDVCVSWKQLTHVSFEAHLAGFPSIFFVFPSLSSVRSSPPSTVSFISGVRKLLTPLHTCKRERVKAFHKFYPAARQAHTSSPAGPDSFEILILGFLLYS